MMHNGEHSNPISLRVSVATYNRVLFHHPQNGTKMLALERKATIRKKQDLRVRAQPFGGGVRILNPGTLQAILGEIKFDSRHSEHEQDLRILIPSYKWGVVKQYCLHHLANAEDHEIESTPDRELVEEFEESLHVNLEPQQYMVQPAGFVIEDHPVPTESADAPGRPTVRIYRIFEVRIVDDALCTLMLDTSRRYSDQDLRALALRDFQTDGTGRANSVLTMPLDVVTESYLGISPEMRYRKIVIENHELDESVLAILGDVDVPQYQKDT